MPFRFTAMAVLVTGDPDRARARMLSTLRSTRGDIEEAARILGIGVRSWHRYADADHLGIAQEIAEILRMHGREHGAGLRPAKPAK